MDSSWGAARGAQRWPGARNLSAAAVCAVAARGCSCCSSRTPFLAWPYCLAQFRFTACEPDSGELAGQIGEVIHPSARESQRPKGSGGVTVHLVELVKIEGTSWFSSREVTVILECSVSGGNDLKGEL